MKKTILYIVFIWLACIPSQAQDLDTPIYTRDKKIPAFYAVPNGAGIIRRDRNSNGVDAQIIQLLNLNKETSLVLRDTLTDTAGGYHETFKQLYKGIDVDGAKCVVHYNKMGIANLISGNLRTIENLNTKPRITDMQSKARAIEIIKNGQFTGAIIHRTIDSLFECSDGTLVIFVSDDVPHLAYKHYIRSMIPSLNKRIYIDADTGGYLGGFCTICDVSTSASTVYSGIRPIETQLLNGSYVLRDLYRGSGVMTYRQNTDNYESPDNTWSNLSDYDRASIDAHWGLEKTYDFYFSKFGRNSYDNYGSCIVSYVNYKEENNGIMIDWPNAKWDGYTHCIYFGRYYNGNSFASLDVAAHELTHGVTQCTSDLNYERESGAINEGMSDVFAACVENEYKTGSQIWKMGEDIISYGMRDLSNPTCKYYHGSGWVNTNQTPTYNNDYCGVHTNSGVFSYWFYLISEGGSGVNQSNLNYPVQSIGLDNAIKICYLMNSAYLSSNSTYSDAKTASYIAAQALGYSDIVIEQLRKAWIDVGVESPKLKIVGNSYFCSSATYYIDDLPPGCTVSWSLSDSYYSNSHNLFVPNFPAVGYCLIIRDEDEDMMNATLTAEIKYNNVTIQTLTKTGLYAYEGFKGQYISGSFSGNIDNIGGSFIIPVTPNCGTTITSPNLLGATVTCSPTATTPDYWAHISSSGELVVIMPTNNNGIPIVFNITDVCGGQYTLNLFAQSSYSINVSNGENGIIVTLNENGDSEREVSHDQSWVVEVCNASTGVLMTTRSSISRSATISTSGWPKGVYVVKVTVGKEVLTEKFIVK